MRQYYYRLAAVGRSVVEADGNTVVWVNYGASHVEVRIVYQSIGEREENYEHCEKNPKSLEKQADNRGGGGAS